MSGPAHLSSLGGLVSMATARAAASSRVLYDQGTNQVRRKGVCAGEVSVLGHGVGVVFCKTDRLALAAGVGA